MGMRFDFCFHFPPLFAGFLTLIFRNFFYVVSLYSYWVALLHGSGIFLLWCPFYNADACFFWHQLHSFGTRSFFFLSWCHFLTLVTFYRRQWSFSVIGGLFLVSGVGMFGTSFPLYRLELILWAPVPTTFRDRNFLSWKVSKVTSQSWCRLLF